jgi:hypothetical protein
VVAGDKPVIVSACGPSTLAGYVAPGVVFVRLLGDVPQRKKARADPSVETPCALSVAEVAVRFVASSV